MAIVVKRPTEYGIDATYMKHIVYRENDGSDYAMVDIGVFVNEQAFLDKKAPVDQFSVQIPLAEITTLNVGESIDAYLQARYGVQDGE